MPNHHDLDTREHEPPSKERLYNLGVGKKKQGDTSTAEEFFKECLRQDPSYVPALVGLGSLYLSAEAPHDNRSHLGWDRPHAEEMMTKVSGIISLPDPTSFRRAQSAPHTTRPPASSSVSHQSSTKSVYGTDGAAEASLAVKEAALRLRRKAYLARRERGTVFG